MSIKKKKEDTFFMHSASWYMKELSTRLGNRRDSALMR